MPNQAAPPSGLRPGLCSVCHHPALVEIDKALISGMSLRPLAALLRALPLGLVSPHQASPPPTCRISTTRTSRPSSPPALDELDLLRVRLDRLF